MLLLPAAVDLQRLVETLDQPQNLETLPGPLFRLPGAQSVCGRCNQPACQDTIGREAVHAVLRLVRLSSAFRFKGRERVDFKSLEFSHHFWSHVPHYAWHRYEFVEGGGE